MYESPIELFISDIQGQIDKQLDDAVYNAVISYGVVVDKEELNRALKYDRGQYEKGLRDGQPKWIPVTERLPECPGVFLVLTKAGNQSVQWFYILDKKWPPEAPEDTLRYFCDELQHEKVTHWMPLPKPPEEEGVI